MPDYSKGKIYKIWSPSTGLTYIGSTTQSLSKRMGQHRISFRQYKKGKYGYTTSFKVLQKEDHRIDLIETCSCSSKEELNKLEGQWIQKTECVNKMIAGRSSAQYRKDNHSVIIQKKREYFKENIDDIRQRAREWYKSNSEKVLTQIKKDICVCECGTKLRRHEIARHRKSQIHQKRMIAKSNGQEYRTKRKTVQCECGCSITEDKLKRHQKSQKHVKLLQRKQEEQQ